MRMIYESVTGGAAHHTLITFFLYREATKHSTSLKPRGLFLVSEKKFIKKVKISFDFQKL
jgi:hypothetical protein